MQQSILPQVIFSPGHLACALADGLVDQGVHVTLCSPGVIATRAHTITADLHLFEQELAGRGDTYMTLLQKHPFTFVTLARQLQSELIARVYAMANDDAFDIVHVYTNEEETALPFAALCKKPVLFTHHDPFNFLVKYKNNFPKYKHLAWLSMSYAQRKGMPKDTHWVGNIYHGLNDPHLHPLQRPTLDYVAFLGRIIQPKGVHLAIQAIKRYNASSSHRLTLKIAGKHYAEHNKDTYWREHVESELGDTVEYVGYIDSSDTKRQFLGNAKALLVPSLFDEPFGLVTIEAFACGTPVIALDSGALSEVIDDGKTGYVVPKSSDDDITADRIATAIADIDQIARTHCRAAYDTRFTLDRMVREHIDVYTKLVSAT